MVERVSTLELVFVFTLTRLTVGDVFSRLRLRIAMGVPRAAGALLALGTVPLGTEVAAVLELAALVTMLVAVFAYEALAGRTG